MARPPKSQRLKALATYRVLAAQARAVLGTTKLTTTAINAMAKTAAMAAVGNAHTFSAAVKASTLITGVETGKFFTLINVEDMMTASEIRNFNMSKLLASETQAVDRALAEVRKVLASAAHVADQVDRLVGKSLDSPATTSELLTRDSTKALTNTTNTSDLAAKGFSTGRVDTTAVSDTTTVTSGKGTTDTTLTADNLSRVVAFVRTFTDTADATDEINANLLMDDGEVIYLEKVVLDNIAAAEHLKVDMARVQADSAAISDAALLAVAKQLDDVVSMGDFDVVEFGKQNDDLISSADETLIDFGMSAHDAATATTQTTRVFHKSLHDTVTTHDALRFFFEAYYETGVATSEIVDVVRIAAGGVPPQLDAQFAADLAALGVRKNFADSVGVSDDIYGEATIDDEQTTFVGKNLPENLTASELRTVALQRTLQESASANSSGLLAMTDYCDSTYFSQAYVGTERIFS